MKYRKLGSTDLQVSEVGFGVRPVSTDGRRKPDEYDAAKLLQTAHSLGITLFDTADVYGEGYGEEMLAKALQAHRHEIIVATKVGCDFYKKPPLFAMLKGRAQELTQNFTPQHIRFACEQSLKRLRSDYIDLYQLHEPPLEVLQQGEMFHILKELQKEGKIRYFGVVLKDPDAGAKELTATLKETALASLQYSYNLMDRELGPAITPVAHERNIGVIVRDPHASGILDGSFSREAAEAQSEPLRDKALENLQKAKALEQFARDRSLTLAQMSLKFCLKEKLVSSVLPSITKMEKLEEFAKASEAGGVSEKDWVLVDELCRSESISNAATKKSRK